MYKDILLPIDLFDEGSWEKALQISIEYSEAFGATLHVLTVIPDSGMSMVSQFFSKNALNEIVSSTKDKLSKFVAGNIPSKVKVQKIVATGNIYETIIKTSKEVDCDVIIMSAHRPDLKDFLLGPNAARVVRHSDKSVLVVRN